MHESDPMTVALASIQDLQPLLEPRAMLYMIEL